MASGLLRIRNAVIAVGLSAALGGCVFGAGPRGYYGGGFVAVAPPAPLFEAYGSPPYPGYIWLGGYWRWNGVRYRWVRGHWNAPRPGYRWVQPQWMHRPRGWRFARGHWERR